ncbi:MAG TPA: helix-turn-helix transcriptional regulator [bacterium]|nr:helix-turn-helix transcriptional regulator [bacterium]HPN45382.1 helix-turn-helix transcriptional regulator [bacterium]
MQEGFGHGCGCHAGRKTRWVEPSILYMLWEQPRHGYELMTDLPELGFVATQGDPGAIYRTLRHLEENGLVVSQWDTSGTGPAKRLYTITPLGIENLQLWAESLRQYKLALDAFLEKIDKIHQKQWSNDETGYTL